MKKSKKELIDEITDRVVKRLKEGTPSRDKDSKNKYSSEKGYLVGVDEYEYKKAPTPKPSPPPKFRPGPMRPGGRGHHTVTTVDIIGV